MASDDGAEGPKRGPDESMSSWISRREAWELPRKRAQYAKWDAEKKARREAREAEAKKKQADTEKNQVEEKRKQAEATKKAAASSALSSGEVSSDDATDSVIMPVRGGNPASQPSSQGAELTAQDLLRRFQKGPEPSDQAEGQAQKHVSDPPSKIPKHSKSSSSDAFLGFGNESTATQQQQPATSRSKSNEKKPIEKTSHARAKPGTSGGSTVKPASKAQSSTISKPSEARRRSSSSADELSKSMPTKAANAQSKAKKSLGSSVLKTPASGSTGSNGGKVPAPAGSANSNNKKRPADTMAAPHERKMSLGTLPKILKKTSVASPQSPDRGEASDSGSGIVVGDEERPPRWYKNEPKPTKRIPSESETLTLLQRLKTAIGKHEVDAVRHTLHELPFKQVNNSLLKGTSMLSDKQGLSQLFDAESLGGRAWPYDIVADSKEIYNKWCRQIFETDLLRGIQLKDESGVRNTDKIQPGYAGRVDFHAFGSNDLTNGQWFPTQLTTIRDGAHGHTQGGISGKKGEGAYSCIMTGVSGYPDQDDGDVVLYCGTDSNDGTVTDNTQLLLDSRTNGRPVRFIRKSTLRSQWAPEVGYRYDGLYDVTDFKILHVDDNLKAARHRFRLVRCPGQDPIRGTGEEKRPTEQEIRRYKDDKRFR